MGYQPNPDEVKIEALFALPMVDGREDIGECILWFKVDPYKVTICYVDVEHNEKTEEFPLDKVKLSGFPRGYFNEEPRWIKLTGKEGAYDNTAFGGSIWHRQYRMAEKSNRVTYSRLLSGTQTLRFPD